MMTIRENGVRKRTVKRRVWSEVWQGNRGLGGAREWCRGRKQASEEMYACVCHHAHRIWRSRSRRPTSPHLASSLSFFFHLLIFLPFPFPFFTHLRFTSQPFALLYRCSHSSLSPGDP